MNGKTDMHDYKQLIKDSLTPPDSFGYGGDLPLFVTWGMSPFSVSRDSIALERSNWEVLTSTLLDQFPDSFKVIHCSHWGVGWIDHLVFDATDAKAVEALMSWVAALSDYPVADEAHYSKLLQEERLEAYDSWARWGVTKVVEEMELDALLDVDGDFAPTDEQEERLVQIVAENLAHTGEDESGLDIPYLKIQLVKEFGG